MRFDFTDHELLAAPTVLCWVALAFGIVMLYNVIRSFGRSLRPFRGRSIVQALIIMILMIINSAIQCYFGFETLASDAVAICSGIIALLQCFRKPSGKQKK